MEAPCSKLQGMFCLAAVLRATVRNSVCFLIRSLTPQQAAGNALAVQYNYRWLSKKVHMQGVVFFQERGYTCSMPSV